MTKFIKIHLKSHEDYKIEEIKSVIEEEKGVRVHASEGELFILYDNLLFYSMSNKKEQVVAPVKYRKKPVVVEAFKWTGGRDQGGEPQWIVDAILNGRIQFTNSGTEQVAMQISSLEGVMTATVGDYIIQGIAGEIYPCNPYIFEQTYEKVEKRGDI